MRSRFPELRLGQVGFVVGLDERDAILVRAAGLGLHVRDRDVRWLIATGQRFDVELAAARRHPYDERATDELRLESVEIACIDPDGASALVTELLGSAPAARLVFVPGSSSYAELRSAVLAGAGAVSTPRLPLG